MELFRNLVYKNSGQIAKTVMSGISETKVGPCTKYGGNSNSLNPGEMLVAAVNSCIMLSFFHFAEKYKVEVASYHSNAEGKVEKTKNGLRFTNVEVKARVSLVRTVDVQKVEEIARLAGKYCLVSGSLSCPVQYNVEVIE